MERLYSIREIRTLLGWGSKQALRVFEREPGVLPIRSGRGYFPKNSYWRLFAPRVPESVLLRVRRQLEETEAEQYRARLAEVMALQAEPSRPRASTRSERPAAARPAPPTHFSIAEIAQLWQLSARAALNLFDGEPGVLPVEIPRYGKKANARLFSRRVPREVVERVHYRLSVKSSESATA